MIGPGLVVAALTAAVVAWGVPPGASRPSIFESEPDLSIIVGGDKAVIRRIIRQHINEVKGCYDEELSRQPNLGGRMMVQFTIAASGEVISSVLQNSTLGNARLESCAVAAVRRWQFPKVLGGGIVIVSYPFLFTPGASPDEDPPAAKKIAADTNPPAARKIVAGTNGAGAVEIETIKPTMYVHRSTDAKAVPSNGLIVVAGGGLLLVDTAWTEPQTEAILAWGDDYFRRPWIGAVITHDHGDRAGGLAALARRRIPIAALDLTVAKMTDRGVRGVTTLFRARDRAFKDPRGFEAFFPGAGHAPDNIVLHFPGLLYGGCLVKSTAANDLGFTGDADLAAWPAAIRSVSDRYKETTIVPGHGSVDRAGDALRHTLDLLVARNRAPRKAVSAK